MYIIYVIHSILVCTHLCWTKLNHKIQQYQVIVFGSPPPSPMCHLLVLITAHYHLLHSVHYTAFDTQLKTVSAKIHCSYFSNCLFFPADNIT